MNQIKVEPLSADVFAPFGDVIECCGEPDKIINQGLCGRYHDCAVMDFSDGQAGLSLFKATPRSFPYTLDMMERHPDGSQAFIPMTQAPFLVIVALDDDGKPGTPRAFVTIPGQAVNYHRNIWHGVCAPLQNSGLFAVVDRIGLGDNLQEHWFDGPFTVAL
ncbi:MAG: ureidoglycolate lyase [Octadecabacter sp.]|jgi:ureidoglycolate lyase